MLRVKLFVFLHNRFSVTRGDAKSVNPGGLSEPQFLEAIEELLRELLIAFLTFSAFDLGSPLTRNDCWLLNLQREG